MGHLVVQLSILVDSATFVQQLLCRVRLLLEEALLVLVVMLTTPIPFRTGELPPAYFAPPKATKASGVPSNNQTISQLARPPQQQQPVQPSTSLRPEAAARVMTPQASLSEVAPSAVQQPSPAHAAALQLPQQVAACIQPPPSHAAAPQAAQHSALAAVQLAAPPTEAPASSQQAGPQQLQPQASLPPTPFSAQRQQPELQPQQAPVASSSGRQLRAGAEAWLRAAQLLGFAAATQAHAPAGAPPPLAIQAGQSAWQTASNKRPRLDPTGGAPPTATEAPSAAATACAPANMPPAPYIPPPPLPPLPQLLQAYSQQAPGCYTAHAGAPHPAWPVPTQAASGVAGNAPAGPWPLPAQPWQTAPAVVAPQHWPPPAAQQQSQQQQQPLQQPAAAQPAQHALQPGGPAGLHTW